MIKCPYCHFDNEDGALFCDQCKSDLSNVAPAVPVVAVPVVAVPVVAVPVLAEPVVVEPMIVEAVPVLAEPVDVVPMAVEAVPVHMSAPGFPSMELGAPVEATPVVLTPVVAEAIATPVVVEAIATPVVVEAVPIQPVVTPPLPVPVPAPVPVMPAPVVPTPAPVVPTPAPVVPTPMPVEPAPVAQAGGSTTLPPGAQPRLLVQRGLKRNAEYPIFDGPNYVGRSDDKPVDIDLEEQEPPDRIWCSRQHCVIFFENNELSIEDLNSSNGTFVNRVRLYPGQKKVLAVGDVVQIGNVQMKLVV